MWVCTEWLGSGLQIRFMQVRSLSPTPSLEIRKCGRARFNAPDLKSDECSNMFREFESHHFHHTRVISSAVESLPYTQFVGSSILSSPTIHAKIAQLANQQIENLCVSDSIPSLGTKTQFWFSTMIKTSHKSTGFGKDPVVMRDFLQAKLTEIPKGVTINT